ncbi:prolipoprotein diacylglyceryl transferase family protein [Calditerrivibrio sp.]|uniref:prolipoprotein diacylglyceryl transferase family protein n=1 Tax=Calditerrivibrio sp. TaxID=2792612 RepID=UPI003D0A95D5
MNFTLLISYIMTLIILIILIRYLPKERYQFIFTIPYKKLEDGRWLGKNITYYGFFNALGYTAGTLVTTALLLSFGLSFLQIFLMILFVFIICIPSSKLLAYIIEKSPHGFTVGGAVFVGVLVLPVAIYLSLKLTNFSIEFKNLIIPVYAVISVGYLMGEGIGRLGCLSFGCCYGKEITKVKSNFLRSFFESFYTVFHGECKKISYASGGCGVRTVPVQAIAILLYITTSFVSILMILKGFIISSLITSTLISQLYRFYSEFLRSDYRGVGKISSYQKMAILNIIIIFIYCYIFNGDVIYPEIQKALLEILSLKFLIFAFFIFLMTFLYTGLSTATYSVIEFKVVEKLKQLPQKS